uniref:Uncharacterized protein n=1 Tax=Ditylenchus dipsaci TaxID=166011 RepID=A0A915E6V9_9BILA
MLACAIFNNEVAGWSLEIVETTYSNKTRHIPTGSGPAIPVLTGCSSHIHVHEQAQKELGRVAQNAIASFGLFCLESCCPNHVVDRFSPIQPHGPCTDWLTDFVTNFSILHWTYGCRRCAHFSVEDIHRFCQLIYGQLIYGQLIYRSIDLQVN